MKGSKDKPFCKFTKRLVALMNKAGYDYGSFDVFQDQRIRQWLKYYTNWPTIPQVFINQKFVGGIDIVSELMEGDEFDEMVPENCKPLKPEEKMKNILAENPLVALINGSIESPADEQSKNLVESLNASKLEYTAVDVQAKPEYLKAFKEGQQVPYVFFQGVAACGPEGVQQLLASTDLKKTVAPRQLTTVERIEALLKNNNVMLFMKGTPENPQCGFSSKTVKLLGEYDGLEWKHFNIFEDNELREALKAYSKWPTYPQLYVKGQLVGGIDILQELHEENELHDMLFPGA